MKQLSIFLIALLAGFAGLHARNISGVVIAENDSTPFPGAVCSLIVNERTVVAAEADANGKFSLQTTLKSDLTLEVGMAGFNPTQIIIEAGAKNVDLGKIYLMPVTTLGEVTVTASSVSDVKGRMVIYPSTADVKASASSISLFQKLPLAGLEANPINRTLTVAGSSPFILINGVPASIDDVNALQPKDIAKIEYSRITPARYADKGTNGFISITLKKRNDGGQIYAWARSALNTAFVDGNFRGSYHQGPSQFTFYYNPSWRNYQKVYDESRSSYIGDDFRVNLESTDRNPFNYFSNSFRLKYDYTPDPSLIFSATVRANPMTSKRSVYGLTKDSELGDYDINSSSSSKDFTPSLDLFLRKDFNASNSLEVQLVGTLASSDYRRSNNYEFEDGDESNYVMDVDSRRRSLISEVSYIHTFSDNTTLSGGFQNTVSRSVNTYLTSDYKPVLTENNNYLYARFSHQLKRVYMSVSTGAKMYWIENDVNKRHYIRNLSNAYLSWSPNQTWNVSGSFNYSPGIPSLSSLTDYAQQTSPYLITNGNPDLKVAEYFSYYLSGSYKYKKIFVMAESYFMNAKNTVFGDITYLGDRMFLSQSVNSKKFHQFQNALSFKLSDINGFGANLNVYLTNYRCAGVNWEHTLTSLSGSMSLWWSKGPFTVSYWRKLPGKYLSGHYVSKEENGDQLSVDYRPDKHWTITAGWMYMFDRKGTRYPSWSYSEVNPSVNKRNISNNANMVVLSLTYATDFGSIFRTGRRSLNNSDNGSSLLKM